MLFSFFCLCPHPSDKLAESSHCLRQLCSALMMLKSRDESLTDSRGQLLSCPARLKKCPRCPLWLIPSPAIDIFNGHMCKSKIIDKCLFDNSNTGSTRIVFLFLSRLQDLTHIRKYGVGTLVRINLRNKG